MGLWIILYTYIIIITVHNYIVHFLILASLVGIPIGITISAIEVKIGVITSAI